MFFKYLSESVNASFLYMFASFVDWKLIEDHIYYERFMVVD